MRGHTYEVAVEIEPGSPTSAEWVGLILTSENPMQLCVPHGFANRFIAISDEVGFRYQGTEYIDATSAASIRWDDPAVGIEWPVLAPLFFGTNFDALLLPEIPAPKLQAR